MTAPAIELEIAPPRATLWFNRPEAANALDRAMFSALAAAIEAIEARADVGVIVLRGRGRGFCAGANLDELGQLEPRSAIEATLAWPQLLDRLAALPIPLVAALHGYALGGGFLISLYCDVRLAVAGTRIGFPAASQFWLPPWGLSRLAAWIGPARTQQMLLFTPELDAAAARMLGLVEDVAPADQFEALVDEAASRLAACRRDVVLEARRFFAALAGRSHAEWDQLSAEGFARTFASPAAQQAIRAILEQSK
ncbi:MAG: enoyl-CoA hydratase/isomerase family protein [Pirellulales bacterium]|nr:enoyl-CoA hydratase/isomerase family protein [Pirellulales bacterium]